MRWPSETWPPERSSVEPLAALWTYSMVFNGGPSAAAAVPPRLCVSGTRMAAVPTATALTAAFQDRKTTMQQRSFPGLSTTWGCVEHAASPRHNGPADTVVSVSEVTERVYW